MKRNILIAGFVIVLIITVIVVFTFYELKSNPPSPNTSNSSNSSNSSNTQCPVCIPPSVYFIKSKSNNGYLLDDNGTAAVDDKLDTKNDNFKWIPEEANMVDNGQLYIMFRNKGTGQYLHREPGKEGSTITTKMYDASDGFYWVIGNPWQEKWSTIYGMWGENTSAYLTHNGNDPSAHLWHTDKSISGHDEVMWEFHPTSFD
jgi:hypothetical protein